MGIFDRFETAVERGMNSVFSRVFRSGLKPVDISSAIRTAMDNAAEASSSKDSSPVAPNQFVIEVSANDYDSIQEEGSPAIAEELALDATKYATTQQYVLLGPVTVEFVKSEEESQGMLNVIAKKHRGSVAPATGAAPSPTHPIIDVGGEKWLLTEDVTVVGRSSKADIRVEDPGVSRQHVEFRITPDGVILTDLGSTNGTFVEGHKIEAATLLDGNQIMIGNTRILFWTHPEA